MKEIKLLIFDCDGVLFDSREANRAYYDYILKEAGRSPLTEEELHFVHMHSLPECLNFLFRDHPELLEKAFQIARETSYVKFFPYMKMEEGLNDFLSWAKTRYLLALCTNRTTSTKPLLEYFDLEKYFDLVRTALEYPKNDPRALKSILEHFNLMPDEALYIGDSEVDERLCIACGVPLIAYKNPKLKALKVIESFQELKTFLEDGLFQRDEAPSPSFLKRPF